MSLKPGKKGDVDKPWMRLSRKKTPYALGSQTVAKTFLIVCEGENTEVEYFRKFPVESVQIIPRHGQSLKGDGKKVGLVKYALQLAKEPDYKGAELWCVFDYDIERGAAHVQPQDFNTAVGMGAHPRSKVRVAWSNDCFELWFLLHYDNLHAPLERGDYYKRLKKHWALESFSREAKTLDFCTTIYDKLREGGNQQRAIEWAREQDEQFEAEGSPPHERCPCTTVYKLVEELNKYLKQ